MLGGGWEGLAVHLVLVSAPGDGPRPHWSQELAARLAQLATARGARVRWLAALHSGSAPPAAVEGVELLAHPVGPARPVWAVAAHHRDTPIERALTRWLRDEPRSVVVHLGVGARGTPNALWLADRLGSAAHAVARGAELVCVRGDLIDRERQPCARFDDPDRCRWCCSAGLFRRPRADDLRNRTDLLSAGLATALTVSVPDADDARFATALGVAPRRVAVGVEPGALVDRCLVRSEGTAGAPDD